MTREQLLKKLKELETVKNKDIKRVMAESAMLEFLADPELDEAYMKAIS